MCSEGQVLGECELLIGFAGHVGGEQGPPAQQPTSKLTWTGWGTGLVWNVVRTTVLGSAGMGFRPAAPMCTVGGYIGIAF